MDCNDLSSDQRKNIMVNYIPKSMNSIELQNLFVPFGPVANVHLVKNNATGEHKGYGFVTYSDEESADKAIASLNGRQVGDKRLRVAYSTPNDDNKPKSGFIATSDDVNVYIANLPKSWKEGDLSEHFEKYGPLKHVKILSDSSGGSRGAGFVRYENSKMAAAAILDMDGKLMEGTNVPLVVKIAEAKKKNNSMGGGNMQNSSSGVPGLILNHSSQNHSPMQASHDHRYNPYGKPAGGAMPHSSPYTHPGAYPPVGSNFAASTMQPRETTPTHPAQSQYPGYNMPPPSMHSSPGMGVPGHSTMQPTYPSHMNMVPPMGQPHSPVVDNKQHYCIYIGNLPETTCKSCLLYQLFSPYGAIANVKPMSNVKPDASNDHWFAFVNMKHTTDAHASIQALNGSTLNGRVLKVDFKSEKKNR